jgi:hypothetical protein
MVAGLNARANSRFHLMQSLNAAESVETSVGAKDACVSSSSWQSVSWLRSCLALPRHLAGDVFCPFQKPDVVLSPSTERKLGAVVRQQGSSCSVNCDLEYHH